MVRLHVRLAAHLCRWIFAAPLCLAITRLNPALPVLMRKAFSLMVAAALSVRQGMRRLMQLIYVLYIIIKQRITHLHIPTSGTHHWQQSAILLGATNDLELLWYNHQLQQWHRTTPKEEVGRMSLALFVAKCFQESGIMDDMETLRESHVERQD
ncbi:hypothetical protein BDB00DRAFT_575600 [Zychaea mexicana]|uniref:uncharacterized protein n=1 Tax=Zychaea mexicana TaxID=64656 RepID=UPI0022FED193|nr:uncharacterized protein BDB00DRAFT_43150 [Zychaea mexicana]XP_052976233.1 uncharacterized protein BDB00DRAFT_575600 [Zychaea mexicana]KAI9488373.1 hypothetical protein BDB00DRAFT_43150 [Zychaea mexicana]KAI9489968.1 hypothetical protein BDB00DRAFT_575600 [Zychaea mexicana]